MDLVTAHPPHPAPRPYPPRRGAPVWHAAATPPRARVAGRGAADRGLDGEALVEGKRRHAQAHLSRRPGARGDCRACARWSARVGRMLRSKLLARAGEGGGAGAAAAIGGGGPRGGGGVRGAPRSSGRKKPRRSCPATPRRRKSLRTKMVCSVGRHHPSEPSRVYVE